MDNFDTILGFVIFMAFVAAFPSEEERKAMAGSDFAYAVFYRFLNNVCINVKTLNPSFGALNLRTQVDTADGRGNATRRTTETSVVSAPSAPKEPA
jgi:hypothetical protein